MSMELAGRIDFKFNRPAVAATSVSLKFWHGIYPSFRFEFSEYTDNVSAAVILVGGWSKRMSVAALKNELSPL
jgi:hypothetical protein